MVKIVNELEDVNNSQQAIVKNQSKIAICALARDCADVLPGNIKRIDRLRGFFSSSVVIIIENDSRDNTKELLVKWRQERTGINVISNDLNHTFKRDLSNPVLPPAGIERIERMAYLRNKYLDWIKYQDIDFDFVLMIDMDLKYFSVKGVIKSIENAPQDWGGIFAYGYKDSKLGNYSFYKLYYDLYAFLDKVPLSKPYLTFPKLFKNSKLINKLIKNQEYLPVASAFGGLGLYKTKAIADLKYDALYNEDSDMEAVCEHIPFNIAVIKRGYQNYIAKPMEVYYGRSHHLAVVRDLLPLPVYKFLAFMVTFKRLKA